MLRLKRSITEDFSEKQLLVLYAMTSQHGGGHSFFGSNRKKKQTNHQGFWANSRPFKMKKDFPCFFGKRCYIFDNNRTHKNLIF